MEQLLEMLRYRRPAYSETEREFIERFILPLKVTTDKMGNLVKRVGDKPEILWSCHTDTVHHSSGMQMLMVENEWARLSPMSHSNCLGADCTTGVWLMIEMIKANIPGLYIFHREEESGGVGSTFIAHKKQKLIKNMKAAVAFDRYGETSVITHQFFQRCCSPEFGRSFAHALGMPLKLDDGGTFTDTANYTEIIGECTNISVGYYDQHMKKERQNLVFARKLRDQLVRMDLSKLVFKRQPGEVDPDDFHGYYTKQSTWTDHYKSWDENQTSTSDYMPRIKMRHLIREYPEEIADMLMEYGVNHDVLAEEIYNRTGTVHV